LQSDPFRDSLRRLAGRAPAPTESGRTTFRLPPRAAEALAWLAAQLRSTQKDVLAGLPSVVEDIRSTDLWDRLGTHVAAAPAPAVATESSVSFDLLNEPFMARQVESGAIAERGGAHIEPEPGARSTYVLPREALERLTYQSEALGLPRDEVVARALVALRAAVELRQASRPDVVLSLVQRVPGFERDVGTAAEEAVALPPHDPIRAHLERAYEHLADARKALEAEPNRGARSEP